jgi:hypothetical protein
MMAQDNKNQNRVNRVEFPWMGPVACPNGGRAHVTKDGEIVYDASSFSEQGRKPYLLQDIEQIAAQFPNHDWRIHLELPGFEQIYQRRNGRWVTLN